LDIYTLSTISRRISGEDFSCWDLSSESISRISVVAHYNVRRIFATVAPASAIFDDCSAQQNGNSVGVHRGLTAGGLHHGSATSHSSVAADHQLLPPTVYDRGYVASPNYPGKYFLDTDCRWRLVVQRQQTIRITLYDFELDVKRAGRCHEFLEIAGLNPSSSLSSVASAVGNDVNSSGGGGGGGGGTGRLYFRDCGSLGKQMLTVDSSEALVRFKTGQASLAQRGFLLYFEGLHILT
jgi:hypothetical protein